MRTVLRSTNANLKQTTTTMAQTKQCQLRYVNDVNDERHFNLRQKLLNQSKTSDVYNIKHLSMAQRERLSPYAGRIKFNEMLSL